MFVESSRQAHRKAHPLATTVDFAPNIWQFEVAAASHPRVVLEMPQLDLQVQPCKVIHECVVGAQLQEHHTPQALMTHCQQQFSKATVLLHSLEIQRQSHDAVQPLAVRGN